MKLILAVVAKEDAKGVSEALLHGGFSVTKLASTGGFLSRGNVTLMAGVAAERVQSALEIIRKTSSAKRYAAAELPVETRDIAPAAMPTEIVVGGATVFVLNVEQYEKL